LLERRPDIRQAEQSLRQVNAEVGIAYTSMFPTLTFSVQGGFENDELTNFLKSPYWYPLGSLVQPLFAMGKNKARLKAARARYEQEVYSYQKTVLTAFKEVNDAIVTIRKAKEVRQSYEKLLSAADTYLNLAQLQYINGVTSYMDVLDAQRGLLEAQLNLNSATLDELLSVVYLYKALGGGYN
jgi:multidrug efflux system outer membrane protein